MEDLMSIASYICNRYADEYGAEIDEMKLHKLMYFSQRESLIQDRVPLFNGVFYGWKYGPILKEIRTAYRDKAFNKNVSDELSDRIAHIMDKIFEEYAGKDSWSLSRLTHGEYAWKNARIGIPEGENGDNSMKLDDIAKDADRIRERRAMLLQFGLG